MTSFVYFDLDTEVRVMFDHVTCVCVWQIHEKFGSSMWSFSWFSQKVNKFEVCSEKAEFKDDSAVSLATSG